MNIIMHYPKKPENIIALQNRFTQIYVQAIIRNLEELKCPKEQKLQLLNEIRKSAGNK